LIGRCAVTFWAPVACCRHIPSQVPSLRAKDTMMPFVPRLSACAQGSPTAMSLCACKCRILHIKASCLPPCKALNRYHILSLADRCCDLLSQKPCGFGVGCRRPRSGAAGSEVS
jgi:hypothetical protein